MKNFIFFSLLLLSSSLFINIVSYILQINKQQQQKKTNENKIKKNI